MGKQAIAQAAMMGLSTTGASARREWPTGTAGSFETLSALCAILAITPTHRASASRALPTASPIISATASALPARPAIFSSTTSASTASKPIPSAKSGLQVFNV